MTTVEVIVTTIAPKGYAFATSTYDGSTVFINHHIVNALNVSQGDMFMATIEQQEGRPTPSVISMVRGFENKNDDDQDEVYDKEYKQLLDKLASHERDCKEQADKLRKMTDEAYKNAEEAQNTYKEVLHIFGLPEGTT